MYTGTNTRRPPGFPPPTSYYLALIVTQIFLHHISLPLSLDMLLSPTSVSSSSFSLLLLALTNNFDSAIAPAGPQTQPSPAQAASGPNSLRRQETTRTLQRSKLSRRTWHSRARGSSPSSSATWRRLRWSVPFSHSRPSHEY